MSEPFIGEIKIVGFNFAPRGWAICEGQLLPISQNTALFSLLGTAFGGDGRTNFGLPDLRGRVPVCVGNGAGLSPRGWGQLGGSETNTLGINNIPSHSHTFAQPAVQGGFDEAEPGNSASFAEAQIYSTQNPDTSLRPGTTSNTGAGQAVNNMQPFLGLYFVIALTGIFPSRN